MVLRPQIRLGVILRGMMLASLLVTGVACVTVDEGTALAAWNVGPTSPSAFPKPST